MDRYTILVVEDDPVIRTQLQTLLQGQAITQLPRRIFSMWQAKHSGSSRIWCCWILHCPGKAASIFVRRSVQFLVCR